MINFEIIINVCIGVFIYKIILSSMGKVLISHFLEKNKTIQKQKKSFREKLKEKLNEDE